MGCFFIHLCLLFWKYYWQSFAHVCTGDVSQYRVEILEYWGFSALTLRMLQYLPAVISTKRVFYPICGTVRIDALRSQVSLLQHSTV